MPPCSDVFVNQPAGYWQRQMLQDLLHRRQGFMAELESMSAFGAKGKVANVVQSQVHQRINAINQVFGEDPVGADPILDEWDAALKDGRTPDFSNTATARKFSKQK